MTSTTHPVIRWAVCALIITVALVNFAHGFLHGLGLHIPGHHR